MYAQIFIKEIRTERFEFSLQGNKIVHRAEYAIDLLVIRYIVAEVSHRRLVNR